LTVTVHVPGLLRNAVEGRRKLNLGLPPSADLGDLVQALLTLYPKLRAHVAQEHSERPGKLKVQMNVLSDARMRRVYLVAGHPRRLAI
jgi:hypothetical protein